jgi:hypothetical protein
VAQPVAGHGFVVRARIPLASEAVTSGRRRGDGALHGGSEAE